MPFISSPNVFRTPETSSTNTATQYRGAGVENIDNTGFSMYLQSQGNVTYKGNSWFAIGKWK